MDYNKILDAYYNNNKPIINNININNFASFIYVINHWSQILGLLISKCDNHKKRKNIIYNLYDENCESYTHVETFYLFLLELGFNKKIDEIENTTYGVLYMRLLTDIISENNFNECCQILGSIEYIYQKISSDIIQWFIKKYNKMPENHFTMHETLDITHAKDFFELNEKEINENALIMGADWIIGIVKEITN